MPMPAPVYLIYCTFPNADKAAEVGRTLVDEKLVACVNIVPGLRSIYRWQGQVYDEAEVLTISKTTVERYSALERRLVELHPYDCPEVIAVRVQDGYEQYLTWVDENTQPPSAP